MTKEIISSFGTEPDSHNDYLSFTPDQLKKTQLTFPIAVLCETIDRVLS
ncbi:hypothetical protein [Microcystis aeruginosa]|nr:hypothetical protein [Microcystis aeruginosa]MDB9416101.1 hypothetical protein [Microcystis aeruginosa CS-556/03]